MKKRKKEVSKLRLERWYDDGFPPIDLHNEVKAIIELVQEIKKLRRYKNLSYQLVQRASVLKAENVLMGQRIRTQEQRETFKDEMTHRLIEKNKKLEKSRNSWFWKFTALLVITVIYWLAGL